MRVAVHPDAELKGSDRNNEVLAPPSNEEFLSGVRLEIAVVGLDLQRQDTRMSARTTNDLPKSSHSERAYQVGLAGLLVNDAVLIQRLVLEPERRTAVPV
jgi:hypothetical protein